MQEVEPDPGSFRDPLSRVLVRSGRVFRGLGPGGAADFAALEASSFFDDAVARGDLVGTRRLAGDEVEAFGRSTTVIEHDRIPTISYPYEWSFGMLRDAALLQLRLTADGAGQQPRHQGRHAIQRAVHRGQAGVHRHRVVREDPAW